MFHTPNIEWTEMQAEALQLPLIKVKTTGKKETEVKDLKKAINIAKQKYNITGIVTGTIASTYQATRIQKICNELKIYCFNPLWQKDQEELLNEIVENKFEVIITQIAAEGFNKDWLGKIITKKTINELKKLNKKYKISLAFEGGEGETFVLNSPLHKKRLKIKTTGKIMHGYSGILEIKEISSIKK